MKISLKHYLVGMIGTGLTFLLSLLGIILFLASPDFEPKLFEYFTVLSNVFVFITSLIGFILYLLSYLKVHDYVGETYQIIRLVSVTCVAITFTMVVVFLVPTYPDFPYFADYNLFMHAIVPIMAVVSYLFMEYAPKVRFRFFFMPIVPVILYGLFYFIYAFSAPYGTDIDWYGFMLKDGFRAAPAEWANITWGNLFLFLAESLGASLVFGLLFWLFNKIMHLVFAGYNLEGDERELDVPIKVQKAEEIEEIEEPNEEKPRKTSVNKTFYKDKARVYHISRSKLVSKHWQVKLALGEKAIKIFDTQLEAINYAKQLIKKNGGSIRIHSMRGQIRK